MSQLTMVLAMVLYHGHGHGHGARHGVVKNGLGLIATSLTLPFAHGAMAAGECTVSGLSCGHSLHAPRVRRDLGMVHSMQQRWLSARSYVNNDEMFTTNMPPRLSWRLGSWTSRSGAPQHATQGVSRREHTHACMATAHRTSVSRHSAGDRWLQQLPVTHVRTTAASKGWHAHRIAAPGALSQPARHSRARYASGVPSR